MVCIALFAIGREIGNGIINYLQQQGIITIED